jgi:protein-S-isoprenylcysteine O-methyltransferase Ste14
LTRTFALLYGLLALAAGAVISACQIAFVGNFLLPKTVDSIGREGDSLFAALVIDIVLLGLFGLQHSVMARPWFKAFWRRIIPEHLERSTYVLLVAVAYALLFWQWRPIGAVIWQTEQPIAIWSIRILFLAGWGLVLWSSHLINPWDMWGFRHVYAYFQGVPYKPLEIQVLGPYHWMRHPIMLGLFIVFWASPLMTVGHALFATVMTAYGLIATIWEERDLIRNYPSYQDYRNSTPMIFPRFGGRRNVLESKPWI